MKGWANVTLFTLLILFVLFVNLMEESEREHRLVMEGDWECIRAMWRMEASK